MRNLFHHLFLPHNSNKHKAKLLHHTSIFFVIVLLLVTEVVLTSVKHSYPDVLGITANISTDELLNLTNQKRAERGLSPLSHNPSLANAAAGKAQDMFTKNYWAHNSPDGGTPWGFIKGAGYEYLYAGENLARGFTTASDVVNAWMESPGHRDNILSPNYSEIGFAIQTGNLTGDETVLVVQMFGSKVAGTQQPEIAAVETVGAAIPTIATVAPTSIPVVQITTAPTPFPTQVDKQPVVAAVQSTPLINDTSFGKQLASILVGFFIVIFLFDVLIVQRRQIMRFVAHNIDHIIFLFVILLIIGIIGKGTVG